MPFTKSVMVTPNSSLSYTGWLNPKFLTATWPELKLEAAGASVLGLTGVDTGGGVSASTVLQSPETQPSGLDSGNIINNMMITLKRVILSRMFPIGVRFLLFYFSFFFYWPTFIQLQF